MADSHEPNATGSKPPRKPRKEWKPTFLAAYAARGTVAAAAEVAGINRSTPYEARETDAEFAAAWDAIETDTVALLEKTGMERALDGSDRLIEFFLRALRPGTYSARVDVKHGGTVHHQVDEALDDEIERFLAANDQAGEGEDGRGDQGSALANGSQPRSDAA